MIPISSFFSRRFSRLIKSVLVVLFVSSTVFAVKDGNVDSSFIANAESFSYGNAVAIQTDGKIIVGGEFTSVNGIPRNSIVRLNTDGTIDNSFAAPPIGGTITGAVYCLAIQPDGKIIVGGGRVSVNGQFRNQIYRLNSDGSVDTTFNVGEGTSGNDRVYAIGLQPDGKILIGGQIGKVNNVFRAGLARLNADGTVDPDFKPIFSGGNISSTQVLAIAVQSNGQIVVGGYFGAVDGSSRKNIVRLNANGTVDQSFGSSINDIGVNGIELQPDGKIIVVGIFSQVNGVNKNKIARLNMDGTLDNSFQANVPFAFSSLNKVRLQSNGKILIVGSFNQVNGVSKNNIARLNSDGSLDNSFVGTSSGRGGSTSAGIINDIALPDNPVVVGGFSALNGIDRFGIGRFDTNGNLDNSFVASVGINGKVNKLFVQPDGKTLVGGEFTHFGISSRSCVARLNNDGSLDQSFNPGIGAGPDAERRVNDIASSANGKIAVAGNFSTFNGLNHRAIVLLKSDGSIDTSFNANLAVGDEIRRVSFYSENKILIVGFFRLPGSTQPSNTANLALLNLDGTRDTTFQIPTLTNGGVGAVLTQSNGKILISGGFTSVNGGSKKILARLNGDGSVDNSFNFILNNEYTASYVTDIFARPDGKMLIAGVFPKPFENYANYPTLIRINSDGSQDSTFNLPNLRIYNSVFAVQKDGRIIGILDNRIPGTNDTHRIVMRFKPDGKFDYSFDINALGAEIQDINYTLAIKPDNKILLGGKFTSYNGVPRFSIVQLENSLLSPPTSFDFDADGKSDISVFRPANGFWYLNLSTKGFEPVYFGTNGDKTVAGDFDGDGQTDIAVWRPANGTWYLQQSTNGFRAYNFGKSGDVPVVGDYDYDGKDDIAVFRPTNGTWYILYSTIGVSLGFKSVHFGTDGDVPIAGDFDGDGRADQAVFRPSNGTWYLNRSTQGFGAVQFGTNEDLPVKGDFDDDGKIDVSVFRPSNGNWYRLNSSNNQFFGQHFGVSEDKPVVADYDGDGKADLAVFRPSRGTWFIQRSTQGFYSEQFGTNSDTPTPAAFRQ